MNFLNKSEQEAVDKALFRHHAKRALTALAIAFVAIGAIAGYASFALGFTERASIMQLYSVTLENASTTNAFNKTIVDAIVVVQNQNLREMGSIPDLEKVTSTNSIIKVSMYTARPEETDDTPCIAASGKNVCKLKESGTNVCANNDLPFGTVIKIAGLGTCVVWDRMNARYTGTNMVDWFASDLKQAREHGVKEYQALIVP